MDSTKKLFADAMKLPLSLGPNYERPLEYVSINQPQFIGEYGIHEYLPSPTQKITDFYRSVLGWIKANPSDQGLPEAMKHFYIFPEGNETDSQNIVNLERNKEVFLKFLTDFSPEALTHVAYIRGKKGIGKTFFLNYILNCYSGVLKAHDVMWYRVDASKVFQNDIDLRTYFYTQVVYVSLKYEEACKYLGNVVEGKLDFLLVLQKIGEFKNIEVARALLNKYKDMMNRKIVAAWFEDISGGVRSRGKKTYFTGLLRDTTFRKEVEILGHVILSYLTARGTRLLLVFDGIDNIDYLRGREKYFNFLGELVNFVGLGVEKPTIYNAKLLVTLRDETFAHLNHRADTYGRPKVFVIKSLKISDILDTKIHKAVSETPDYFHNIRGKASSAVEEYEPFKKKRIDDKYFDRKLRRFGLTFTSTLCKQLERWNVLSSPRPDQILLTLYNENTRAFINNILNAYEYNLLFEAKKGLTGRPYVLLEGLFLDGSLFIDSTSVAPRRESFINIFYYSNSHISQIWHGLCGVRLLQLLMLGPYGIEDIRNRMVDIFDYDGSIVEEFIQRFVEHGVVTPRLDAEDNIKYMVLPKGRFLFDCSRSLINFLYHSALDTPLSYRLLDNSNYVRIHTKFWVEYTECAVKTTLTLIRHINSHDKKEKDQIQQTEKDSSRRDPVYKMFAKQELSFDNIAHEMAVMANSLPTDRKERLLRDIQGLTEQWT